MNATTPKPPEHPAPTLMDAKPKRWYHQWTQMGEPKREARPRPPLRWRAVMRLLPWRVRMRLLDRYVKLQRNWR